MPRRLFYFIVLFCLSGFYASNVNAQSVGDSSHLLIVSGRVTDTAGTPIPFATVGVPGQVLQTSTDSKGRYSLDISSLLGQVSVRVMVASVGMQMQQVLIPAVKPKVFDNVNITLQQLSLRLNQVEVNVKRTADAASNSSIHFGREVIEQLQATSIADVLKLLPGKTITNPSLQSPNMLTLRSEADGRSAQNNAFGTAIIIDDIQVSNNANMQNLNIGKHGLGSSGAITSRQSGVGDFANSGIDLRQIPVDNVESIEVVSGVASARYGDLTDGMVIVNRQAGKAPLRVNIRLRGTTTNFSADKGFKLKGKSALNVSLNYLNSNENPRNNLKSYNRVSAGLIWTTYVGKNDFIKNTASLDLARNFDNAKQDPDDDSRRKALFKYQSFSFSDRLSFKWRSKWLLSSRVNVSIGITETESYDQWYINGAPFPVADGLTTGTYEGFYAPGNYLAYRRILGKPVTASVRQENSLLLSTWGLKHNLSLGLSSSYSANKGRGVVIDPDKPRFAGSGGVTDLFYKGDRPYSFKIVPSEVNTGLYIEDNFRFSMLGKVVNVNAGARADWQNGAFSAAPRINASYELSKRWKLMAAYGTATKSASLSMRYPGPVYFDMPLINYYINRANENLYLVHTEVVNANNAHLKAMRSSSWEIGGSYDHPYFSASLFGYYKKVNDGFGSRKVLDPIELPVYTYEPRDGQPPLYTATGATKKYPLYYEEVVNALSSTSKGVELVVSTEKIKAIQTSFNLSTALSNSNYRNSGRDVEFLDITNINWDIDALFGVYDKSRYEQQQIKSTFSSSTHIPALAFVISLTAEIFWQQSTRSFGQSEYPVGYYDRQLNYHDIAPADAKGPRYAHLIYLDNSAQYTSNERPIIYTNYHLRLSKEVTRNLRFSFNVNNVFNYRPKYYDRVKNTVYQYNQAPSYGAELSFKF